MTWKSNKFVFAPRDSHKVKRVSCHMNSTVLILTNTKDCTCFLEKVLLLWCLSLILCLSSVTGKVLRPDPRLQRPNWAEPSLHAATHTARSPAVASVSELTCIYCDGGQDLSSRRQRDCGALPAGFFPGLRGQDEDLQPHLNVGARGPAQSAWLRQRPRTHSQRRTQRIQRGGGVGVRLLHGLWPLRLRNKALLPPTPAQGY